MHPYFELIIKYFPELSKRQISQFEQLWEFYHDWNAKINIISRKDIDEIYLRHVLHSLSIAKVFTFQPGSQVLDVGTGGGFPGIPLSIYFDQVNFTLIDSIGKKIRVVNEAVKTLDLQNAQGMQIRAERMNTRFDIIVSRAVARLSTFVHWISGKIRNGHSSGVENGIIYIKGGPVEEELKEVPWTHEIYDISSFFKEPFFETKKIVHLWQ